MQFLDEIEIHVPALRRYARALTRDTDRADDEKCTAATRKRDQARGRRLRRHPGEPTLLSFFWDRLDMV